MAFFRNKSSLRSWVYSSSIELRAVFAAIMLTLLLGACDTSREWKEEVELKDGRVVLAERTSTAARFGEPGQKLGRVKYWSIRLEKPVPLFWEGDLAPIILHLDNQYAYIVSRIVLTWRECKKYGYPNPPFVYFRSPLGSSKWERIDATKLPDGLKVNLLLGIWNGSKETSKDFFNAQDRRKIDHYSDLAKKGFDKLKPFPPEWCDEVRLEDQKTGFK